MKICPTPLFLINPFGSLLIDVFFKNCNSDNFYCVLLDSFILNAVVSLALAQDSYSVSEGVMVEVCATISNIPIGGLECPVVASLVASDGTACEL